MLELNEINLGNWENLNLEEMKNKFPQEFNERGRKLAGFHPPDGESFSEVQKRVLRVFIPLIEHIHSHILVVGHAGVNRVILYYLLGMLLQNMFRIEQDYGALNIIAAGDRLRLLELNIRLPNSRG